MGDTNLTNVAGILKRQYDDYVEIQQNLKHHTLDEFAKSLSKYSPAGEGFFGAIDDYGNESIGAINEEEQFRTIDSEHYLQWKVSPKIMVAPIQFSGLVAKAADSDVEAFAAAVVDALDKARERLLKDENRQFFGYGQGVLSSPAQAVASAATSFTVSSAQYFRANQVIDVFTSTGGSSVATALRIQDVDKINNVLIFANPVAITLASTNVIVKQNILSSTPPADGKELMGLRGIVDDGTDLSTFQNISYSSTVNLIWSGRRINASSANLSADLMQRLIDDVRVRGGDEPDSLIMHPLQRRSYLNLVVPQKRYMDGKMDTGYKELEFNGLSMMIDEDCQNDTLYALKKSLIRKFELSPMEMGTHDGSDVFLRLSNYDQFQAYWRHYVNMGTSKRAAHGKIVSLAVPTGAA
jgi:hypothetical protein